MMYQNKFVAALKVNGKILREFNEVVKLPFGAEYSIYLKNLSTVRASVKITIDGKDILGGDSLVLNAGQETNLQRSLNGNNDIGNAFKFIERTANVEQSKGIGSEDGLVRIEYQFEKIYPNMFTSNNWTLGSPQYPAYRTLLKGSPNHASDCISSYLGAVASASTDTINADPLSFNAVMQNSAQANTTLTTTALSPNKVLRSTTKTASLPAEPKNEAGITVPGRVIEQKFHTVSSFSMEAEKHVMILHLLGEIAGQPVQEAVTVKAKPKCVTCGKVNKAFNKFCSACGTSLEIV